MSNNYVVYMHISPSNKRYIGITCKKPEHRWNNGNNYKHNIHFTRAIEKYGWDNFQHIIIVKGLTEDEAKWLEIELIKEWDSANRDKGYNISLGGDIVSDETREKLRNVNLGRHHSDETKEKLSKVRIGKYCGKNSPMFGIPKSEEHKRKVSETKKRNGKSKGKNNPNAKSVINLTTKRIFFTANEGAEYYGIKYGCYIGGCCRGYRIKNGEIKLIKSCGKLEDGTPLVWRFLIHRHNIILRGKDISKLHIKREVA